MLQGLGEWQNLVLFTFVPEKDRKVLRVVGAGDSRDRRDHSRILYV